MSWIAQTLPYLGEQNVHRRIDFEKSAYSTENQKLGLHTIPILQCPSNPAGRSSVSYAGVHHDVEAPIDVDNHGVLFLNSRIQIPEDVPDGLSYTLFVGETEAGTSWMVGDNQTLRNTGKNPVDASGLKMAAYLPPGSPGADPIEEAETEAGNAPAPNLVGALRASTRGQQRAAG